MLLRTSNHSSRRIGRVIATAAAAAAVTLLAACSSGTTTAETEAPSEGAIVFVHDQQAGDGAVTDSTIAGVEQVAEENGWTSQAIYVADAANYESTLRNVAQTSPTVIVTEFYRITDATNVIAAEFPDIKFLHLYADPEEPAIPNLLTVSYDVYQASYLLGAASAAFSETGKIGMVLGDTQPLLAADYNAYLAGAQSVNPDIEVSYGVVGNFDDATKAQEVAEQLYASGVDIIMANSGGADSGVIAAAKAGEGRFLTTTSGGWFFTEAPESTVAVGGLEFKDSVIESLPVLMASDFAGGHFATGIGPTLKVTLAEASPTEAVSARFDAAVAAVADLEAGVTDGSIEVPFVTDMP